MILAETSFRPTRSANTHLTLKFLGDVPTQDVDGVTQALATLGREHPPFVVSSQGFGAFPDSRGAKVFWAGVGNGKEWLASLASDVDAALGPLGFRPEKSFTPHFTLARARRSVRLDPTVVPAPPPVGFTVAGFDLVESVLGESGTAYRSRATYPLADTP